MILTELKDEFKIAFEDLATSGSKGLDEYEISVCLTKGQENVIYQLMQAGDMHNLSPIIDVLSLSTPIGAGVMLMGNGSRYATPENAMGILDRVVKYGDDIIGTEVVPPGVISNMFKAAYKYPPKNVAYVMVEENSETVFPPLNYLIGEYVYTYIKYPRDIVLEGVITNNVTVPASNPSLNSPLHRRIVEAAVQYAVGTYIGQPEKTLGNDNSGNK